MVLDHFGRLRFHLSLSYFHNVIYQFDFFSLVVHTSWTRTVQVTCFCQDSDFN
ncbi:hypothetical protein HanRHA438_Chr08g0338551 [Helianthus annuus]|uniref:Uncharacterized protein n=1 Tax=Helianthus annuus TaxID=4232 RepID=A0A251U375_HELAN|nr:hypothetical protein HanXRQr2_Chr08g0327411 [Helianthus annuus]KAJ0545787.1 hypothetical protein HanIR_Chr08g0353621 [Helianthus annuus]KAJ0896793.1 hypothetical protein HanRHA438_Chr08g0338551 [Helianthus annuus]